MLITSEPYLYLALHHCTCADRNQTLVQISVLIRRYYGAFPTASTVHNLTNNIHCQSQNCYHFFPTSTVLNEKVVGLATSRLVIILEISTNIHVLKMREQQLSHDGCSYLRGRLYTVGMAEKAKPGWYGTYPNKW